MIGRLREHEHKTQAPAGPGSRRSTQQHILTSGTVAGNKPRPLKPDGAKPAAEAPARPNKAPAPAACPGSPPLNRKPQAHAAGASGRTAGRAAEITNTIAAVEGMGGRLTGPGTAQHRRCKRLDERTPRSQCQDQYNDTLAVLWNDKLGKATRRKITTRPSIQGHSEVLQSGG